MRIVLMFLALLGLGAPATAAVPIVDADGKLTGATGVIVGDGVYDVSFVDGSCIGLFSGCDQPTDFDFSNYDDARAAALALFSDVFVDGALGAFDSVPALTNGCDGSEFSSCIVVVPYTYYTATTFLGTAAVNAPNELSDQFGHFQPGRSTDYTNARSNVFADFTYVGKVSLQTAAVPEPTTWAMMLLGFGAIGFRLQRRRQRAKLAQIA